MYYIIFLSESKKCKLSTFLLRFAFYFNVATGFGAQALYLKLFGSFAAWCALEIDCKVKLSL
jgi:hypothetical protein